MKYSVEKVESRIHVKFTATTAEFEKHMQKAYEQNKGKYAIQGFRKGKAPRKILEQNYGADLFFEDAIYLAASEYFGEYLDKNKDVQPIARPRIDNDIERNAKHVKFTIVFAVKPEVELGQYKELEIKKEKVSVKTAEVEEELKKIQQRNARHIEITDRPVAEGDTIVLDYSGAVDGVKFDGGTAEKQNLTIGSHMFIPGFEEQLVGVAIGETKDITVTFPEDYHAENLKGKQAVFTCTVHEIKKTELPEIDDEFAKEVSEFSTLKAYKADIKKTLLEAKEKDAATKNENKLLEKIVEGAKLSVPEELIEEQIDNYIEEFKYQLSYQGLKYEDYFKYTQTTVEQLRETYRSRSQKAVTTRLVMEEIINAEKITVDQEEVEAQIKAYAEQCGIEFEPFNSKLTPDQKAYFENQALTEKLMVFLKEQNTFVD